jgi:hypothetical protein
MPDLVFKALWPGGLPLTLGGFRKEESTMGPIMKINHYKTGDREEWRIKCDHPEEAEKVPSIIKTINNEKAKKNSLYEKIKEIIYTAPIKLILSIIAGLAVAFFTWYFGFN